MVAEDIIIAPIITEEASMRIAERKIHFPCCKKGNKNRY